MRNSRKARIGLSLVALASVFVLAQTKAPARPSGAYLGQTPPGMTPEIFAPGLVSTGLAELNSVFSPDGREFYFCVRNMAASSLFVLKRDGETWGPPRPLPFAGPYNDIDVSLSPDGRRMYFCSNRPPSGEGPAKSDYDIWTCERAGDSWGSPERLGDEVNSPRDDFYPVLTNGGTLYFNSQRAGPGTNDIYACRRAGGRFAAAEKLGPEINSEFREFDAYVDPDERFIVFTSERPEGDRMGDLYISVRTEGGTWSRARNLGRAVNGPGPEYGAVLTPDRKYLFFTRASMPSIVRPAGRPLTLEDYVRTHLGPGNGSTDIWWVDARVLEDARAGSVRTAGDGNPAPESRAPLSLVYIANMGVLVSGGGTKVLIDALYDRPNPEYRAPTAEDLDKMIKGEAPFDGIDLAVVTHNHPDHFAAGVAARFLAAQPRAVLAAPADAVAELRRAAADWPAIQSRVVSLDLKPGEALAGKAGGVPFTAVRTLHSGDRESPMNLMFLLDLAGRKVFHEGDSAGKPEVFNGFGLESGPIDLAVVHYWFVLEPAMAKFFQETCRPAHIALGHLPIRLEGETPAKIDLVRSYYKDIVLMTPGMPVRVL